MGHAMHTVRREERRRSREEDDGDGGGKEEDPGGGEERREKQGKNEEKDEEREKGPSAGRVRLRGALLKTYILSILIRTIMEVNTTNRGGKLSTKIFHSSKSVVMGLEVYLHTSKVTCIKI